MDVLLYRWCKLIVDGWMLAETGNFGDYDAYQEFFDKKVTFTMTVRIYQDMPDDDFYTYGVWRSEKEPTCLICDRTEEEVPESAFHTFWATAEQYGMRNGMYHDSCFWEVVSG